MTPKELAEALRQLNTGKISDVEPNHVKADQLLLEYIDDPGVTAAFNDLTKWYE